MTLLPSSRLQVTLFNLRGPADMDPDLTTLDPDGGAGGEQRSADDGTAEVERAFDEWAEQRRWWQPWMPETT
jgi:hypothetical protein